MLDELLNNSKSAELFSKRIEEKRLELESKNLAQTEDEPITFHHSISRINDNGFNRNDVRIFNGSTSLEFPKYEQEFSLSKNIKLGDIQKLERNQNRLNNEAYLIEQGSYMVDFNNRLKNLYHQYCLDTQYIESFEEGYNKFLTLYEKKKRAYEEDEIAKTELLQLEFEQNRLTIELENLNRKEQSDKKRLFWLTDLGQEHTLSCQDVYPIIQEVNIKDSAFQISQKAYQKRIESTQVGLKRYSKKIDSIEISMGYGREIDRDMYTIGVAIPLNFSTNKTEYEKASLMHQSTALTLENKQLVEQKIYKLKELNAKLRRDYQNIQSKEENIESYENNLLTLMKKSYDYGESSVIEYLLSQQKLYALQQELLEKKKGYYKTLFQFYTVSETKDTK